MIPEKSPIFWEGKLIGHIGDMRGETFGVYGKWLPIDSPTTTAFLKLLEEHDEIFVEVGKKSNTRRHWFRLILRRSSRHQIQKYSLMWRIVRSFSPICYDRSPTYEEIL
jgi:hypothetical protein